MSLVWFVAGSLLVGVAFDLGFVQHLCLVLGIACLAMGVQERDSE